MKALKRKLFLSIASLAVCAATLVSTTFAWYTSNSDVTATGLEATSSAQADTLLLISKDGSNGTWSNTVDLSDVVKFNELKPVAYTAGENANTQGTFQTFADGAVTGQVTDANNQYVYFDLYFRGGTALKVYLQEFTITNETAALPAKDVLATAGGLDATTQKTYTVDVLRTLMVEMTTSTIAEDVEGEKTVTLFNPEGILTTKTDSLSGKTAATDPFDNGANFNAHLYYNEVTGKTIAADSENIDSAKTIATEATGGKSKINLGTTPVATGSDKKNCVKATFKIFINGWDFACFDAVQGQTFSVNLKFTCSETAEVLYA